MTERTETDAVTAVQSADHWSKNAKQYSTLASKVPIVYFFSDCAAVNLLTAAAERLSSLQSGGTFLDVCAGPAVFSLAVLKALGTEQSAGVNLIISDFSAGMVEAAREAIETVYPSRANTQFLLLDVQNIDLPSETADVVGCMFGYFVPDRLKAFSEVHRVCKPAGIAVIGTWKYAGFAFILGDFLQFLGNTNTYRALEVAHCCADGEALSTELLGLGFSAVQVHEHTNVFEMPLQGSALEALLDNPMIKTELSVFDKEFVLSEWTRFVSQPDFKYDIDAAQQVLLVRYTANIAIAHK